MVFSKPLVKAASKVIHSVSERIVQINVIHPVVAIVVYVTVTVIITLENVDLDSSEHDSLNHMVRGI